MLSFQDFQSMSEILFYGLVFKALIGERMTLGGCITYLYRSFALYLSIEIQTFNVNWT